jgi:small conductance mechanosensitive channel
MPPFEVLLALALALLSAYVISDVVARAVASTLKAVLPSDHERRSVTRPVLVVRVVTFLIAAVALAFPALRLAGYRIGTTETPENVARTLLVGGMKIAAITLGAYAVVRLGAAAAQRFEREMSTGTGLAALERSKRAQTLGRLIQNTLSILATSTAGLMMLRVLDVDITPVLTGAGIVGLAVGFGAQTLVRDIISGFFLILEDQVRVGDVAIVNGQGGLVEAVNLRTIVLRDEEGTVHVVPNGEVKTLSNRSKDFSYYLIAIALPFDGDADRLAAAMRSAADSLMSDPGFAVHILAPLEISGVDDYKAGQMTLKARIKTVPLKQWLVGRELRKRIAAICRERGIALPSPSMNVHVDGLKELLAPGRSDK